MLLADGIGAAPIQFLDFLPVRTLEWTKYTDIARLELVGSVGGQSTKYYVVLGAEL